MARSLLLVAATVLLSLAAVHLLVRADLIPATVWSYYPILLAVAIALIFVMRAFRRSPASAGGDR